MNAFVQKLSRTCSVMKLYLRETPIQEQIKIKTAARNANISRLKSSRPFSGKTNDKLSEIVEFVLFIICKVSGFCK